jgi:hypothetical protein
MQQIAVRCIVIIARTLSAVQINLFYDVEKCFTSGARNFLQYTRARDRFW